MFVPSGISSERVAESSAQSPEEGIMPKQSPKNVAIRTCALALVSGLSLNSFAIANGAVSRPAPVSAKTATSALPKTDPSPSPTPVKPGMSPAKDNMATQSDQGRRYGQSGFVGEPINLNVVNADVRDILNYITEQYGINFVIDSSVGAVPVTVNVQDVPWNLALEMILRSNKLGVQVNGNILRIATVDSLAKESETQKVINDARLDTTQLVTEFIRLNYARATGTLSTVGGSSGNFSGGVTTNASMSSGSGASSSPGAGGDQGILP